MKKAITTLSGTTERPVAIHKCYEKVYDSVDAAKFVRPLGSGFLGWLPFEGKVCYWPNRHSHMAEVLRYIHWDEPAAEFIEQREFVFHKRVRQTRDRQKQLAYNWEDSIFHGTSPRMSREEVQQLFLQIKSDYDLNNVHLKFNKSEIGSHGGYNGISLAYFHQVKYVVLHEMAHVIHDRALIKVKREVRKKTVEGHGPGWLSIYIVLLYQYGALEDYNFLIQSAKDSYLLLYEDFIRAACQGIEK